MPELPEVETIKLQLQKYLVGHTIKDIKILSNRVISGDTKIIKNAKVIDIRRFGKVTVIDLSNNYSILIHVKLTGQIIYRNEERGISKQVSSKVIGGLGGPHTLVVFELDRGGKLYYNDVRRFGWIKVAKSEELKTKNDFISKLGTDALEITLEEFQKVFSKTSQAIKVALMDQARLSGVGNIYANDALWLAKINPKTPAKELQSDKVNKLHSALITVLKDGLKYGGASELAFVTPDGTEGEYQNHTLVYGHEGEICKHCKKEKISKFFLGGRGTYWCASCQK